MKPDRLAVQRDLHHPMSSQHEVNWSLRSNASFLNLEILQSSETLLQTFFVGASDAMLIVDQQGQVVGINPAGCTLLGQSEAELHNSVGQGRLPNGAIANQWVARLNLAELWQNCLEQGRSTGEVCIKDANGTPHNLEYVATTHGLKDYLLLVLRDVTQHKQAEAEIRRLNTELEQRVAERTAELRRANEELQKREEQLELAIAREQLLASLTQAIRQSLDLEDVLTATVDQVRQVLKVDRVLIYRFVADWSGVIAVESVAQPCLSILGRTIYDPCFSGSWVEPYRQGRIHAVSDLRTDSLASCYTEFLESLQVRANLVVPILQVNATLPTSRETPHRVAASPTPDLHPSNPTLWGLLIAHQCDQPRQWHPIEIDLLKQLAVQVGVAIQQSELYRQVQDLNVTLEHQVLERTAQLQQSLDFEAMLKHITDRVRDSLDEDEILQTAVEALARGLSVDCCDTGIYNPEQTVCTIRHECTTSLPSAMGLQPQINESPDIYNPLLQGQWVQFCSIAINTIRPIQQKYTILACPIQDDQGVIGDLWLFQDRLLTFNELEVRLVQQVANQCAIAIRQARLYQAVQAQVLELERLNQLKDDFLCTVSHELRTPISNINLAAHLLEVLMQQEGWFDHETSQASRYLQILQDECQRETELINDLLDLQRLDAGTEALIPSIIHLQSWIPHLAEPFETRALNRGQQLNIYVSADLPELVSDRVSLERVITELLNNACKYTPPGEQITVFADFNSTSLNGQENSAAAHLIAHPSNSSTTPPALIEIRVQNTGVEIPSHELSRVFEKFYRVPNGDPWKYGGTGLGLALVKKLIEHLGGTITVSSSEGVTTFTITLAIAPPSFQ
ncbi:MAG: GAF domain-containing protein [Oculatellaceae cyanobacterium bins.114]|nr:GAF domain-containing protein [Oculatellaceae cyanobacterium bins.114]